MLVVPCNPEQMSQQRKRQRANAPNSYSSGLVTCHPAGLVIAMATTPASVVPHFRADAHGDTTAPECRSRARRRAAYEIPIRSSFIKDVRVPLYDNDSDLPISKPPNSP